MPFTPNCNPYISILSNCAGHVDLVKIKDYTICIVITSPGTEDKWKTEFKIVRYRNRQAAITDGIYDNIEDAINHACKLAGVFDPEYAKRESKKFEINESLKNLEKMQNILDSEKITDLKNELHKKLYNLLKKEAEVKSGV